MSKIKEKLLAALVAALLPLAVLVLPQKANVSYAQPSTRVNADTVDGFHASGTPTPDYLLALDVNGKFPVSVLTMGSGSFLDADLLDGLDSSAFVLKGEANAVTVDMLIDGSVTTAKIADNAVTDSKIANITRVITANIMGWPSEEGWDVFGNGIRTRGWGGSGYNYSFVLPYDYAGGDLIVREWWQSIDNLGGTATFLYYAKKMTPSGQMISLSSGWERFDFSMPNWEEQRTWTLPASLGFEAGDMIWAHFWRQGNDPVDTMGRADLKAVGVEYTAEQ
ncbi:hypothetical protein GTO10_05255 [Candidatus Saccharibacteria bacterium]|nr:hypothetical protein [Candidatus Saccharibacteria bacterium]